MNKLRATKPRLKAYTINEMQNKNLSYSEYTIIVDVPR